MKTIYLVQGNGSRPPYKFPSGSDCLYLQWQAVYQPVEHGFHYPGSSWASGRNELYRRARIKGTYDYYIFVDDDLSFDNVSQYKRARKDIRRLVRKRRPLSAWGLWRSYTRGLKSPVTLERFEELLLANGSLVGVPRVWGHPWNSDYSFREVEAVSYADQCMIAIHHSIADTLLPYSTEFDDLNWWTCGELFFERAAKLYWGRVHRFSNLHVFNLENREYPRQMQGWRVPINQIGKAVREPVREVAIVSPSEPSLEESSSIVVTSISRPTASLRVIGERRSQRAFEFLVIGDARTPADFQVEGCDYWSMTRQRELPFRLARELPENSYSRKNLGYLIALRNPKTRFLIDTDDDNTPLETFWLPRTMENEVDCLTGTGWLNAYRFFTKQNVWPRGFPLEHVHHHPGNAPAVATNGDSEKRCLSTDERRTCLVQQGLVQHDPDVDAIFRQTQILPVWFAERKPIYLEPGLWCPVNSQNTTWSVDIAPLMYLPSNCSMREADIWRGLVAQRVLWTFGAGVMFHQATMLQVRNPHNLTEDFKEEARLYIRVAGEATRLGALSLTPGAPALEGNLLRCYEELVRSDVLPRDEISLLASWLNDVAVARG